MWITKCKHEGEIWEIMCYHRPVPLIGFNPLAGCVVTISSYAKYERSFARISSQERGVLWLTHLLTLEPSGKKYAATINGKLPAVKKHWLLECVRTGKLMSEKGHLVGESVAPERKEESFSQIDQLSSKPCVGEVKAKEVATLNSVFSRLHRGFSTRSSRRLAFQSKFHLWFSHVVLFNNADGTLKTPIRTPETYSQETVTKKITASETVTHVDTPETF